MMNLSRLTDNELLDIIEPLTARVHQIADILETEDTPLSVTDLDREVLEVLEKQFPYLQEFAKRYPDEVKMQQQNRDIKMYMFNIRRRAKALGLTEGI